MESLALAAAVIVLSFWLTAAAALIFTFFKLKFLGAFFGSLSIIAGVWLWCVLPHAPLLGAINVIAGAIAIKKYFKK